VKVFTGKVISIKMAKTATIEVERRLAHPVYGKRVKRSKKYHVHDEIGVKVGETVRFVAGRPVSKLKKWRVIEVVGEKSKKKGKK
jgi:small subunit ribosomal protein S17